MVVREQPAEALEVIEARAAEVGATVLLEGRDWESRPGSPPWAARRSACAASHATYEELFLPLFGEHAGRNAAAAMVAVEALLGRRARRGCGPRGPLGAPRRPAGSRWSVAAR